MEKVLTKREQIIESLKAGKSFETIAAEVGCHISYPAIINKDERFIVPPTRDTAKIKELKDLVSLGASTPELLKMGFSGSQINSVRYRMKKSADEVNLDRPSSEQREPLVKPREGMGKYHQTAARISKRSEPVPQTQWEYKIGENVTLKIDAKAMDNVILDMKRGKVTIHVTNI